MADLLTKNSFHLLGLDTNAAQKDINKRFREISKYLSIDENPSYKTDICEFNGNRNLETIKYAMHELTDPKKKVIHYFFWFQVDDEDDEEALKNICSKKHQEAIQLWCADNKVPAHKMYKSKNLALLYCYLMLLDKEGKNKYLSGSIALWKSILESDKYWQSFEKNYLLHDDLHTQKDIISRFGNNVKSYLADIYTEISQKHNDYTYFEEFYKSFTTKGEKLEDETLSPIYRKLNHVIDLLNSMNISEDGVMDEEESNIVKTSLQAMQEELNKTIDLGLYDDSHTRVIRDNAASSLRSISIDIYNNLWETEKADALMKIAEQISGTESFKGKIKEETKTISASVDTEPVIELIKEQKFDQALNLIYKLEKERQGDERFIEALEPYKVICITSVCAEKQTLANSYVETEGYDKAKAIYEEEALLLYQNMHLFAVNKEAVDELLDKVKAYVLIISKRQDLVLIDSYLKNLISSIKENLHNEYDQLAMILLFKAKAYADLMPRMKEIRKKEKVANVFYTLGWITIWIYGLGIIFFLLGAWYQQKKD